MKKRNKVILLTILLFVLILLFFRSCFPLISFFGDHSGNLKHKNSIEEREYIQLFDKAIRSNIHSWDRMSSKKRHLFSIFLYQRQILAVHKVNLIENKSFEDLVVLQDTIVSTSKDVTYEGCQVDEACLSISTPAIN